MKKSRYAGEQIIGVLEQMEAGRSVADLARELRGSGTRTTNFYLWDSWRPGLV